MPNNPWYDALPRKREAADVLLTDAAGAVLLVRAAYGNKIWSPPGGVVEVDEPPRAAAAREAVEELGIEVAVGRLLVVDWEPCTPDLPIDGLMTIFDGGVLSADQIAAIRLPADELTAYTFCPPDELSGLLPAQLARRVQAALVAKESGVVGCLEDGY